MNLSTPAAIALTISLHLLASAAVASTLAISDGPSAPLVAAYLAGITGLCAWISTYLIWTRHRRLPSAGTDGDSST